MPFPFYGLRGFHVREMDSDRRGMPAGPSLLRAAPFRSEKSRLREPAARKCTGVPPGRSQARPRPGLPRERLRASPPPVPATRFPPCREPACGARRRAPRSLAPYPGNNDDRAHPFRPAACPAQWRSHNRPFSVYATNPRHPDINRPSPCNVPHDSGRLEAVGHRFKPSAVVPSIRSRTPSPNGAAYLNAGGNPRQGISLSLRKRATIRVQRYSKDCIIQNYILLKIRLCSQKVEKVEKCFPVGKHIMLWKRAKRPGVALLRRDMPVLPDFKHGNMKKNKLLWRSGTLKLPSVGICPCSGDEGGIGLASGSAGTGEGVPPDLPGKCGESPSYTEAGNAMAKSTRNLVYGNPYTLF